MKSIITNYILHVLSSLILVHLGNRMEIPAAVWSSALENSAPVISQPELGKKICK